MKYCAVHLGYSPTDFYLESHLISAVDHQFLSHNLHAMCITSNSTHSITLLAQFFILPHNTNSNLKLISDGICLILLQNRTSSAEFQIALQANFHCLLVAELDMKLPYGKDCISVWKRTNYVRGRVTMSASSVKPKCVNCDCCPESEGGKPRPKEEVLAIENGEEEEKKGEMEDAIQPPSPTTDTAADAVSYMSLSDLALLRGTSSDAAPAAAAALDNADAVSYMSLSDLALLRGASTSGAENDDQQLPDKKKAKQSSTVSSEDHSHHDHGHDHATHAPLPLTAMSTDALVAKDENAKGTGDSGDYLAFMKAEEMKESAKAQRNSLRISGRKRIRASKEPVHTHDHTHAHDKKEEEEEESEEEALHRQREEDLSGQYEESDDKLWAHIPLGSYRNHTVLLYYNTILHYCTALPQCAAISHQYNSLVPCTTMPHYYTALRCCNTMQQNALRCNVAQSFCDVLSGAKYCYYTAQFYSKPLCIASHRTTLHRIKLHHTASICSACILLIQHVPLTDEILPVDRAAPCLAHLLAAYPAGGRTVISY